MISRLSRGFLLLLLITFISGCTSSHREAHKLGIKSVPRDASSILGTYANVSADSRPNLRLWEIVKVSGSSTWSLETDRVQILSAGPGKIGLRLLREGRLVDQMITAFSPRDNHLHLRTRRSFRLLPFGFGRNRQTVSASSTSEGELVVVSHSSFFGLMLFYSAGDSSTRAYEFARVE